MVAEMPLDNRTVTKFTAFAAIPDFSPAVIIGDQTT
jgi:hypothetical protein